MVGYSESIVINVGLDGSDIVSSIGYIGCNGLDDCSDEVEIGRGNVIENCGIGVSSDVGGRLSSDSCTIDVEYELGDNKYFKNAGYESSLNVHLKNVVVTNKLGRDLDIRLKFIDTNINISGEFVGYNIDTGSKSKWVDSDKRNDKMDDSKEDCGIRLNIKGGDNINLCGVKFIDIDFVGVDSEKIIDCNGALYSGGFLDLISNKIILRDSINITGGNFSGSELLLEKKNILRSEGDLSIGTSNFNGAWDIIVEGLLNIDTKLDYNYAGKINSKDLVISGINVASGDNIFVKNDIKIDATGVVNISGIVQHLGHFRICGDKINLNGIVEGGFDGNGLEILVKNDVTITNSNIIVPSLVLHGYGISKDKELESGENLVISGSNIDILDKCKLNIKHIKITSDGVRVLEGDLGSRFDDVYSDRVLARATVYGKRGYIDGQETIAKFSAKYLEVTSNKIEIKGSIVITESFNVSNSGNLEIFIEPIVAKLRFISHAGHVTAKYYSGHLLSSVFYGAASQFGCSSANILVTQGGYAYTFCGSHGHDCEHHLAFPYTEAECRTHQNVAPAALIAKVTSGQFKTIVVGLGSDGSGQLNSNIMLGLNHALDYKLDYKLHTNAVINSNGMVLTHNNNFIGHLKKVAIEKFVHRGEDIKPFERIKSSINYIDKILPHSVGNIKKNDNYVVDFKEQIIVQEKYKSLYACKDGTVTLLNDLGVDASDIKIFATPSLEASLVEGIAINDLDMSNLDIDVKKDRALDGSAEKKQDNSQVLDRCKMLSKLLANAKNERIKLGLVVGEPFNIEQCNNAAQAFAWPVYHQITHEARDYKVLVLDVCIPTEILEKSVARQGGSLLKLGEVNATIDTLINVGQIETTGGKLDVGTLVQTGTMTNSEKEIELHFARSMITSIVHYFKSEIQISSTILIQAVLQGLDKESKITMVTEGDVAIYAAKFKNVAFKVNGQIVFMPIALVEAYKGKVARNQHLEKVSVDCMMSEFEGSIDIISQDQMHLIGVDATNLDIISINATKGINIETVNKIDYSYSVTTKKGIFSKETKSEKHINVVPKNNQLGSDNTRADVTFIAQDGDIKISGTRIYAESLNIQAGSIDNPRSVQLLSSSTYTLSELLSKKSSLFEFSGGTFYLTRDVEKFSQNITETQIPTILNVAKGGAYIFSGGQLLQVSSYIDVDGKLHISSPVGYRITALNAKQIHYVSLEKSGVGISFTATSSELSMSAGVMVHAENYRLSENTPVVSRITARNLVIESNGMLETNGVIMQYDSGYFNVLQHIDKPLFNQTTEDYQVTESHIGLKIGFRSNLMNAIKATQHLAKQNVNAPESAINAYSSAKYAYVAWMKTIAAPIQGGVWIEGNVHEHQMNVVQAIPIVTEITANTTIHELEKLDFEGTKMRGNSWYILHAKEILLGTSFSSFESTTSTSNANLQIPISANVANLDVSTHHAKSTQSQTFYTDIQLSDNVVIQVNGTMTLNGASIIANNVKLNVKNLILKSIHSLANNNASGFQIGADLLATASEMLSSVGASTQQGDKAWITQLTQIIGRQNVHIIVAESIHILGALIANIPGDDPLFKGNADSTTSGIASSRAFASTPNTPNIPNTPNFSNAPTSSSLYIKAAEIFAQEIYGYDNGHTLGIAINLAYTNKATTDIFGDNIPASAGIGNEYMLDLAYKAITQTIRPTVTNGDIILTAPNAVIPTTLNRDINNIITTSGTEINPIHAYDAQFLDGKLFSQKILDTAKDIAQKLTKKTHDDITITITPNPYEEYEKYNQCDNGDADDTINTDDAKDTKDTKNKNVKKPKIKEQKKPKQPNIKEQKQQKQQNLEIQNNVNQVKPSIELVVRNVKYTNGIFKHAFTIFTNSNNQKTIITAYPKNDNMLIGNLEVIDVPYIKDNEKILRDDWVEEDKDKNKNYKAKYRVIKITLLNNDKELANHLSKAREAIKHIETGNNGGRFDYDLCFTHKCWGGNSNTVQKVIYEAMNIKFDIPKDISLPGIKGKLYKGHLDDALREYGEELQKYEP